LTNDRTAKSYFGYDRGDNWGLMPASQESANARSEPAKFAARHRSKHVMENPSDRSFRFGIANFFSESSNGLFRKNISTGVIKRIGNLPCKLSISGPQTPFPALRREV